MFGHIDAVYIFLASYLSISLTFMRRSMLLTKRRQRYDDRDTAKWLHYIRQQYHDSGNDATKKEHYPQ